MLVILYNKDTGEETRRVPTGVPLKLESYEKVKGTDKPIVTTQLDKIIFKLCHNKLCNRYGVYRYR